MADSPFDSFNFGDAEILESQDSLGEWKLLCHRRVLPNGRIVAFWYRIQTSPDSQLTFGTVELIDYPYLDCPCPARNILDIHLCEREDCQKAVCGQAARRCSICAKVLCVYCTKAVTYKKQSVFICIECDKEVRTPKWLKALKKLLLLS